MKNIQGDDDEVAFRNSVDYASRNLSVEGTLLNKVAVAFDQREVDAMMSGHAQKARIHSRDTLADALETSCRRLEDHIAASEKDVDQEIKVRVAVVSSVVVR